MLTVKSSESLPHRTTTRNSPSGRIAPVLLGSKKNSFSLLLFSSSRTLKNSLPNSRLSSSLTLASSGLPLQVTIASNGYWADSEVSTCLTPEVDFGKSRLRVPVTAVRLWRMTTKVTSRVARSLNKPEELCTQQISKYSQSLFCIHICCYCINIPLLTCYRRHWCSDGVTTFCSVLVLLLIHNPNTLKVSL